MLFESLNKGRCVGLVRINCLIIALVLPLLTATSLIAQSGNELITGIVKDSETGEVIPFAHVVLDDVITLTNLDGEFVISMPSIKSFSTLKVSVMGYDLGKAPISQDQHFYPIHLAPSTVQLQEVTIKSGPGLMNDVFNRFHLNYEMSRRYLHGYYRENLTGTETMYYLAEGILDIYVPPNIDHSPALVNPIRTRKKIIEELDDDHVFLKGNASDMVQSSIWRKESFLHPKNRNNYHFFYTGTSKIGDFEVFTVEFEPSNSKGDTRGKIYIEENTLAIVKLEYQPHIAKNNFWSSVSWIEEYYSKNGIFELFRVSYTGIWNTKEKEYVYNALLVVNESDISNVLPDSTFFLTQHDAFFHEAEDDFSDAFWDGYNYIKLDLASLKHVNEQ